MLGLSVDSFASLRAFSMTLGNLSYPLLGDFNPKGKVLHDYGVYNEEGGTARRSVFIIDKDGVVRWKNAYQPGNLPDAKDVLAELEKLQA